MMRFLHTCTIRVCVSVLCLCFAKPIMAQELNSGLTINAAEQEQLFGTQEAWLKTTTLHEKYLKQAVELAFQSVKPPTMQFEPRVAFTWTSVGDWSGDVLTWIGDGRIQMVGCIGSHSTSRSTRELFYEFQSFASVATAEADFDGAFTWKAPVMTETMSRLQDAMVPSPSAKLRLVQMRQLAKTFVAGMQVQDDQVERELRLLSQPISRVVAGSNTIVDSALFAYVSSSGTDPEVLLLLEAHHTDDGLVWLFLPGRFTTREVWLTRGGREVWRAKAIDEWSFPLQIQDAYFYRTGKSFVSEE